MTMIRKSPLQKTPAQNGWVVIQKNIGKPSKLWRRKKGEAVEEFSGSEADAIYASTSLVKKEIPGHWLAMPTGMDLQVHLRFPGQPGKETLEGGLESAMLGGYDAIITMPNTAPFLDTPENLESARNEFVKNNLPQPVKVGFTAAATIGMQGEVASNISGLKKAGAVAITDDGWGVKSATAQAAVFAACAENDLLFQQHAETPGHKGVATASKFQSEAGLPEYPRQAESSMIARDLEILRKHKNARYHVLHVSTIESLRLIREAKSEGLRVTAEVTPHHLIFCNEDIPSTSDTKCTFFKMNPPLFSANDRAALRLALRDGTIDCVSTDHAPHEWENKQKGWLLAPFGTRGLETALPALLQLFVEGELSWQRLLEVFCYKPREILANPFFSRPEGLLFVDTTVKYEVTEAELPGISKNSCFLGKTLQGRLEMRAEDGEIFERIR